LPRSCADFDDDEEALDAACETEIEARKALLLTKPATIAGVAAVLEYFSHYEHTPDGREQHDENVETILAGAYGMLDVDEAAYAFLPMIAATLRRLASAI
jgi:hypothetical protein